MGILSALARTAGRGGRAFMDHSAKRGVLWGAGAQGVGGALGAWGQQGDGDDILRAALINAAFGGSAASAGIRSILHAGPLLGVTLGSMMGRADPDAAKRRHDICRATGGRRYGHDC